jgi:hypothetical protein
MSKAPVTLVELINMPLHATVDIDPNMSVTKVPGGWIYRIADWQGEAPTSTFVRGTGQL